MVHFGNNGRKIEIGDLHISDAAREIVTDSDALMAVTRTARCDYGDVDEDQWAMNEHALELRGRIQATFKTELGEEFWTVVDMARRVTHVALPSDYD